MDKHSKNREKSLLKSLYKTIKKMRHKDAVEDVLDNNTTAEMDPDNIPKGSSSIMNKSKMQKKQDKPQANQEEAKKSEEIISDLIKNFNVISKAYKEKLDKKEDKKEFTLKADHKSDKGGLTEKGRKAYNKATGSNLKRPQPEGGKRKKSFCARNKGQIDMHNIDCKKTPEKRACKARKRWKC